MRRASGFALWERKELPFPAPDRKGRGKGDVFFCFGEKENQRVKVASLDLRGEIEPGAERG